MLLSAARRRAHALNVIVICAVAALALSAVAPTAHAAAAAVAPAAAHAADQGLSGTAAAMGQTNGDVEALAVSGGVLYAGGTFTTATSTSGGAVSRTYLAAFSTTTGELSSSFDHALNGDVEALSVSPGGTTLYLGGSFTTVDGQTRNRLAAIDLTTNTLKPWAPSMSGIVDALTSTNSAVYAGGAFSQVNSATQKYLVGLDPTTGSKLAGWTGSADARVYALALTTDGAGLLVGGAFSTLSGQAEHAIGKVSPTTGAALAWSPQGTLSNTAQCSATAKDIVVSGSTAYVASQGKQSGCFDGDEAVNTADGTVVWINHCEGATQTLAVVAGVLYKGSAMHDCAYNAGGDGGGFTGAWATSGRAYYHLQAQSAATGNFVHWSPATDSVTGPLAMATDGSQLFVGGGFTTVNKLSQQHLVRFAPLTAANNAAPKTPTKPTIVATAQGQATVTWSATTDADTGTLTYQLFRIWLEDSGDGTTYTTTQVATLTAESWPWAQPTLRYVDSGINTDLATQPVRYKVSASDGVTTTARSLFSNQVEVKTTTPPSYDVTLAGLCPGLDWKLDGNVKGSRCGPYTGSFVGGVTTGAADDRGGNNAVSLDGSSGYIRSANPVSMSTSAAFTTVAWVKTSTLSGGDISGFSADRNGTTGVGRVVWMDDDGQIVFGLNTAPTGTGPATTVVRSPNSSNDGRWHMVTAVYDGSTMTLYIDGVAVGAATATETTPTSGYFRVGHVNLSSFNQVFGVNTTGRTSPNSFFLNGSVDDVAAWTSALTAAQVSQLWTANAAYAP